MRRPDHFDAQLLVQFTRPIARMNPQTVEVQHVGYFFELLGQPAEENFLLYYVNRAVKKFIMNHASILCYAANKSS